MLENELGEETESSALRNLRLLIEYSGDSFAGWQVQPNQRTGMGEVERAIAEITQETVRIVAASRTDAGVHALGQVASFKSSSKLSTDRLWSGLNAMLPEGIAIKSVRDVPSDFHARYSARGKRYLYRILDRPTASPLEATTSWHVTDPLDVGAMQVAAQHLVGERDFSALATKREEGDTCVRRLHSVTVGRGPSLAGPEGVLTIEVVGDSFLYKMVRTIVGTLVLVGKGKQPPCWVQRALRTRDRALTGPTAPPQGLFLMRVFYEDNEQSTPHRGTFEGRRREGHHYGPQHAGSRQRQGICGAEGQEARTLL